MRQEFISGFLSTFEKQAAFSFRPAASAVKKTVQRGAKRFKELFTGSKVPGLTEKADKARAASKGASKAYSQALDRESVLQTFTPSKGYAWPQAKYRDAYYSTAKASQQAARAASLESKKHVGTVVGTAGVGAAGLYGLTKRKKKK